MLDCIFAWLRSCSKYLHHTLFCLFCIVRSCKATALGALSLLSSFPSSSLRRPYRRLQRGCAVTAYGRSETCMVRLTCNMKKGPPDSPLSYCPSERYPYFQFVFSSFCSSLVNYLEYLERVIIDSLFLLCGVYCFFFFI